MNIASYIARYLLVAIFSLELFYKLIDWPGWEAQFASMLPLELSFGVVPFAAMTMVALEITVVILLVSGREKFFSGLLAGFLLLGILVAFQRINIGYGLYSDPIAATRGILQDQHLWMILAAALVTVEGWDTIKKRHKK